MVYIIVLNWNGAKDTWLCLESLFKINFEQYRIVIIDNDSEDDSCAFLKRKIEEKFHPKTGSFIDLEFSEIDTYLVKEEHKIILAKSDYNRGYAGGNNLGITLAINQQDMEYVWVLNNDTEVEENALMHLFNKSKIDSSIGICGSRLIYFEDRTMQQGLGGIHNKWLCTTKNYEMGRFVNKQYDDNYVSNNIDYVIGAAMFFSRNCLESIGLMQEDYFLYYEELDICLRAKLKGFRLGVCSDSIVFHKIGASTEGGTSLIADKCSIRNRLLITARFYPKYYWLVWLSLFGVALNRARRKQYKKMSTCLKIMFSQNIKK